MTAGKNPRSFKKKGAKKAAKKDEAPPKPIKWADPPRRVKDTL